MSSTITRERLVEFLQRQRFGVVATRGPDGQPQCAVVGLATDRDGNMVFDTLVTSRKAKNLRADSRVAVVFWEGARTAQLEGRAVEPKGEERERALASYLDVFPDGHDRLGDPDITHFRIEPHWARYSDYDAKPEPLIVEVPFD